MRLQDFVARVRKIVLDPVKFFRALKKEGGIPQAFVFYAMILGVFVVLAFVVSVVQSIVMGTLMGGALLVAMWVGVYAVALGFSFVSAGLLHVWIWLFGGRARFEKTYQLFAYSSTPGLLLGWIPLVGMLGSIWNLVLLVIGVQETHKVSFMRALVMFVIIPIVFLFVLMLLGVGFLAYLFTR